MLIKHLHSLWAQHQVIPLCVEASWQMQTHILWRVHVAEVSVQTLRVLSRSKVQLTQLSHLLQEKQWGLETQIHRAESENTRTKSLWNFFLQIFRSWCNFLKIIFRCASISWIGYATISWDISKQDLRTYRPPYLKLQSYNLDLFVLWSGSCPECTGCFFKLVPP